MKVRDPTRLSVTATGRVAITYRSQSPRATMVKYAQNEFLINVAIFTQISYARCIAAKVRCIQIFRPFESARESFEAGQTERERESERAIHWARTLFSLKLHSRLPFFEIKNSILSVARYTQEGLFTS